MGYRRDLWEIAAAGHGVVTVSEAEDAGVPAVEVRKLAARGALQGLGQGVYRHLDIPLSPLTQPALAVALGGEGAFLHREAVLDLLELGHFNPHKIRVATKRRVRRALPGWMVLEQRCDVPDEEITTYFGITATTVHRAIEDMAERMPSERWKIIIHEAERRDLITPDDLSQFMKGAL